MHLLRNSTTWMQTLWQDLRYAVRGLHRAPGFFFTVVGTIALGLGVNTALFTVFNAYALQPLAVRDPGTLYKVGWLNRSGETVFSGQDAHRIFTDLTTVSESIFSRYALVNVENQSLVSASVSANYFSVLGVGMAMGRPFLKSDALDANSPVAVLSDAAWRGRFAADPGILGKPVRIQGKFYEVVGVARPGFDGLENVPADLWITQRAADVFDSVVARLKPGTTPAQAEAELLGRAREVTSDRPETQKVATALLHSAATVIPRDAEFLAAVAPIMAAFALVLLIACANVANMMLARALGRQREIGVRISLGASRSRLIRQLVTESVVLAIPAALTGLVISQIVIHLAEKVVFASLPPYLAAFVRPLDLTPDGWVFLFDFGACIAATLVFGLVPALRTTRPNLMAAVRGEPIGGVPASRLRNGLVISQVTICLVLLVCAGIFLQSTRKLAERDSGMAVRGVMSVEFNRAVPEPVMQQLASEPWVKSTAVVMQAPFYSALEKIPVTASDNTSQTSSGYNFVSPEYLPLLGIPLVRGRNFTAQEANAESSVAIVSETTAKQLWPGRDALGQWVQIAPSAEPRAGDGRRPGFRAARVIGVAKDIANGVLFLKPDLSCLYFPTHAQSGRSSSLLVGLTEDSVFTRRALDDLLQRVAPEAVQNAHAIPLQEIIDTQVWPFRMGLIIASLLGGLALLLTLSGIYGVLAYTVASRTREVGVRMALGATAPAVVRIVVWQSLRMALIGGGIGLVLALGVSRLFASRIEIVNTFDAVAYLGGVAAVLLAAAAAAYFPSRRAARVDPMVALRAE